MQAFVKQVSRRTVSSACSLLAVLVLIAHALPEAAGQAPSPVGFDVVVSPYARVLDAFHDKLAGTISAQTFMDIQMEESCDNPHLRVRARNKPAIMLTSLMTSVAPLTSFTINIEEGDFAFGSGDIPMDNFTGFVRLASMYSDSGVSITGSSLSNANKTLTVNFSGLEQGKTVIFNVDLDPTAGGAFPFPDYRNVLFGAPVDADADQTDPATYTANFGVAPNTTAVPGTFVQLTDVPDYSNDTIRPYRNMDMVEIIPGGGMIPEPSSAALLLAAVAGLAAVGRRRRAA